MRRSFYSRLSSVGAYSAPEKSLSMVKGWRAVLGPNYAVGKHGGCYYHKRILRADHGEQVMQGMW